MNTHLKAKSLAVLLVGIMAVTAGGGLAAGAAAGAATSTIQARLLAPAAPSSRVITVSTTAAAPAATPAATTPAASVADSLQAAVESVYAQANPSVVYIVVSAGGNGFGYGGQASGSGFVYNQNGMIVTNAHVVDGAQTIDVVFADGSRQSANLVGEDPANDLAVIQVSRLPATAKPLTLAADSSVQVGEFVAAIGSPFGEQNSMSFGIVSGLNRTMSSGSSSGRFARNSSLGSALNSLIQTDAPINPGNSGGPLLDLSGQVVGINNAIESSSGSNAGVGFAIPVSVVRQVVPALIANGG